MSAKTNCVNKTNETRPRIARECRLDDRNKSGKGNTRVVDTSSKKSIVDRQPCLKKTTSVVTSLPCNKKSTLGVKANLNSDNSDRSSKTSWFEVLIESPKTSNKVLQTNHSKFEIPCPCKRALNDVAESRKENFAPRSENNRRFNLLVDMLQDKISETSKILLMFEGFVPRAF